MNNIVVHLAYEHHVNDVRIFLKECISLKEMGKEIIYVTASKHDEKQDNYVSGVRVIALEVTKKRGIRRVLKYQYDLYKKCLELNADVYHIHEYLLLPIGNKLKCIGKKVIYDTHENYSVEWSRKIKKIFGLEKIICRVLDKYEEQCIKRFDGFIAAVPDVYKQLSYLNENSALIQNYPVIGDLECKYEDFLYRDSNVCYTGIISRERGLSKLIASLSKANSGLLLAGKGTEEYMEQLKKMDEWKHVSYKGYLSRPEMSSEVLQKSIAGVILFQPIEGYMNAVPNKLFEYMSAGLPFIASDFSFWKSELEALDCGLFVNPENVKEIAETIVFLTKNREVACEMGKRGRTAILNKYNWCHEIEKLFTLYNRI